MDRGEEATMSETNVATPTVLSPRATSVMAWLLFGIAFLILGLCFVFGPVFTFLGRTEYNTSTDFSYFWNVPIGIVVLAVGIIYTFRAPRMRVILTETDITIRTFFTTKRIPRSAVYGIGYVSAAAFRRTFLAIVWRNPTTGKMKKTGIPFLVAISTGAPTLSAELNTMNDIVKTWVGPDRR
jgi:hypothetical protein